MTRAAVKWQENNDKNDVDDILIIILPYHVDISSLPVKKNNIGPTVDNRAEREKRTERKTKKDNWTTKWWYQQLYFPALGRKLVDKMS